MITNADRIRSMTDEELAVNINNYFVNCPPKNCIGGPCTECWLEWLKQEAKENKND